MIRVLAGLDRDRACDAMHLRIAAHDEPDNRRTLTAVTDVLTRRAAHAQS